MCLCASQHSDVCSGRTPACSALLAEGAMPDSGCVMDERREPRGQLASRVLAMPTNTTPKGDIFGGWIMSLMDMAGKISATDVAGGRVVTVAVDRIVFREPVKVGDVVCCYTDTVRAGRTSITLSIEVWALRQG